MAIFNQIIFLAPLTKIIGDIKYARIQVQLVFGGFVERYIRGLWFQNFGQQERTIAT